LTAQATDAHGRLSNTLAGHFTVDTIPPAVTVTSPQSGLLTNQPGQTIEGTVSEPAGLLINSQIVQSTADGRFSHAITLQEGLNKITVVAIDGASNAGQAQIDITLDTVAPAAPNGSLINAAAPVNGQTTVTGKAGAVEALSSVRITNLKSNQLVTVMAGTDGAFSAQIAAAGGDEFAILAIDKAGNQSLSLRIQAGSSTFPPPAPGGPLPPDPAIVAPAIDQTSFVGLLTLTKFLYSGDNPIQIGVSSDVIQLKSAAVLRGRLLTRDDQPLPGVKITISNHPEYGSTLSRADGTFDMVVNAGSALTVQYDKPDYLPAQRKATPKANDFTWLPNVVLINLDAKVTSIDLKSDLPIQIAQGTKITDSSGTRQATLMFNRGTTATIDKSDGTIQDVTGLKIRATEYTVGSNGPNAMPASLPFASGYTYAVEFSADEALNAGAKTVRFSQPVINYTENFLNFPVGSIVPTGYYDRDKAAWIASDNGRVVKIVAINDGVATVDVDGKGGTEGLGITEVERRQMATLYQIGQTLWRVPIPHFTPWDHNWPVGPPDDAESPSQEEPAIENDEEEPCKAAGSIIECENQVLGEEITVTGTSYSLNYRSDRVPGRLSRRSINIRLSGETVPASLQAIELHISIAGQHFQKTFSAIPNQSYAFVWDGKDGYGRVQQGTHPVAIRIGYQYQGVYKSPADFAQSFGQFSGGTITGDRARQLITIWQEWTKSLGIWDASAVGLGGWTLNSHHAYDPYGKAIYFGDGSDQYGESIANIIATIAGNGVRSSEGDGGTATEASFNLPYGPAVDSKGNVYVPEVLGHRVRKISPDGTISTVAGTGARGFGGDGGVATAALMKNPYAVALDSADNLYIAENYSRVRKVDTNGIITTVVGTGIQGYSGDGGPASAAQIDGPHALAFDGEDNLYIADTYNNRIRKVSKETGIIATVVGQGGNFHGQVASGRPATQTYLNYPKSIAFDKQNNNLYIADSENYVLRKVTPDGIIHTIAGSPFQWSTSGDGGQASNARMYPLSVAVDSIGNIYVADEGLVRKITTDGIIGTIAGKSSKGYSGDNGPASAATLYYYLAGMALDLEGNLLIADTSNQRIRRISSTMPSFNSIDFLLPSASGKEIYQFSQSGKHLKTINALTNETLLRFGYDPHGFLATITDGDNNTTRIVRDAAGSPEAIIGQDGHQTRFTVSPDGFLSSVINPAQETHKMVYGSSGLLDRYTNPRTIATELTYDESGRLVRDVGAAGNSWTFSKENASSSGYDVLKVSALGRTSKYSIQTLPDQSKRNTVVLPDGSTHTKTEKSDGSRIVVNSDGTIISTEKGADTRFGMQSPYEKQRIVKTPSGLASAITREVTTTLGSTGDLSSLLTQTETTVINGKTFKNIFNASQKQYILTTPLGRQTVSNIDGQGRLVMEQVTGVEPVQHTYDARGRLAFVAQGSGPVERKVSFTYNADGWVHSVADPLLRKTEYRYDPAGRITKVILPDLREIGYSYDPNGNITSITPPSRPSHGFGYNNVDLETGYQPPEFGTGPKPTAYRYNLDKQITDIIRPDGRTSAFDYDTGGRLSTVTAPHGVTTYSYTPTTGTLAGIVAPGGVGLAYTYDGSLPLTETLTGPVTGAVAVAYNGDFNIRALTIGGMEFSYSYDNDGLLTGAGAMSIRRDSGNGFITGTQLGSAVTAQSYNAFGEIQEFSATQAGAALFAQSYTRDQLGRIARKVETVAGQTDGYGYEYNDVGRLVKATKNGSVIATYQYDANGNRTNDSLNSAAYDAQDRLTQYGAITYTYTDNGELKTQSVAGQTVRYDYDVSGNLRAAALADGSNVDYLIDGRNRRIGKKVNGNLVQGFLYQGQLTPAAELNSAGDVTARFIYGTKANVPDYIVKGGVTYRIVSDHLGSVRMVVDTSNGNVVQRMDYDAYGYIIQDTNPGFHPFGFAGGIYDRDTKLTRFGARDYDAATGRWTVKDPIRFDGEDTNLYAYVENDPTNYFDPDGLTRSTPPTKVGNSTVRIDAPVQPNQQTHAHVETKGVKGETIVNKDGTGSHGTKKEKIEKIPNKVKEFLRGKGFTIPGIIPLICPLCPFFPPVDYTKDGFCPV